jgi:hypothetical protein
MDRFRYPRRSTVTAARVVAASLFALAFLTGAVRAESPAPTVTAPKTAKPERVLFVGNSYLYYGDSLHNHVRRMVLAAKLADSKKLKF